MSYPYGPPPQQQGWGPPQQPQPGGWGAPPPPQQNGWGQPPAQPQGWGPPSPQDQQWAAAQEQGPAPVQGTLADFYGQPSVGGGKGLSFKEMGTEHYIIVNRQITDADVQQQTGVGQNAKPQFFNDGRPKMVLKVPANVRPSQDYQDGKATWWCGPRERDQLNAGVAASGAPIITHPTGVQYYLPEPGSLIRVKKAGKTPSGPGYNDANRWEVQYWRPDQAQIAAQQLGIEYPSVTQLAATSDDEQPGADAGPQSTPAPGQAQATGQFPAPNGGGINFGAPPFTPTAQAGPPVGPPPSAADFAPPVPGQPGNPAQWQPQPSTQNGPQAPQQLPGVGGPPPPVDWGNGQQQAPQGHIPQPSAPAADQWQPTPENQALMAQMTGRAQQ